MATARSLRTTTFAARALALLIVLALSPVGCKRAEKQTSGTQEVEIACALPDLDSAEASPQPDATATPIAAAWDLAALGLGWADDGWQLDADAPAKPSVATPDGTAVEGLSLQRGDTRGELFLYTYTKEGYARAHQRAELAHSASRRHGSQLLVVYSADSSRAESLLDALKLP